MKVKNFILNPPAMFVIGLLTGFVVKEMDIHFYAQRFGISLSDIFSTVGVWIVIGVAISLYSKNTKFAMANIFTFCIGMLITYYITARLTHSVYGWTYIKGWTLFACVSPVMAWLVIQAKKRGIVPVLIRIGIFAGYIFMNILLGGFIKVYDLVFFMILIYLLFLKKMS